VAYEPGLPRKVLLKANALGVHNDCIVAAAEDIEKSCDACTKIVMDSLAFFYSHLETREQRETAILQDLNAEREGYFNE